ARRRGRAGARRGGLGGRPSERDRAQAEGLRRGRDLDRRGWSDRREGPGGGPPGRAPPGAGRPPRVPRGGVGARLGSPEAQARGHAAHRAVDPRTTWKRPPDMLFPTVDFAVFFVVVFTLSWLTRPYKRLWRWVILAASCV